MILNEETPVPYEQEYPEEAAALVEICHHNAVCSLEDRILVNLDNGTTHRATIRKVDTPDRNSLCPCNSNKKFKRCCFLTK